MSEKGLKYLSIAAFVFLLIMIIAPITPAGRAILNLWEYRLKKVDDATKYETRKQVEDPCRAMITSYTSDALTYEQYKDSADKEKQSWAEQAKMRANKTAASYNEYILKNSYVWEDNIPRDIRKTLPYIE